LFVHLNVEALFFYFDILHVHLFIQRNIQGAMKILWKLSKMMAVTGNLKKKILVGKELIA